MDTAFSRAPAEAVLKATSHDATWHQQHPFSSAANAYTIAISREAGALGSSVGQELALRLGWRLYDQELVNRIAAGMGLRPSQLNSVDERPANVVREVIEGFQSKGISTSSYVHNLVQTLELLSVEGKCIIVGRGAAHFLPAESTLRVRLVAPRAFRIATIQQSRGLTAKEAGHWIDATDRARMEFLKEFPGKDPTDPTLYDLVLNVPRFTVPQVAELIEDALRVLEQKGAKR